MENIRIMFKILDINNNEILPATFGTREMAQIVANFLSAEQGGLFLVQ